MKKHDAQGRSTRTRVETTQTTRTTQTGDTSLSTLTPMEEKVIRMLHGLGEEDSKALEFAVGASEDARLRLALMEAHNIASPELGGQIPTGPSASDAALQDIVRRYGDSV